MQLQSKAVAGEERQTNICVFINKRLHRLVFFRSMFFILDL